MEERRQERSKNVFDRRDEDTKERIMNMMIYLSVERLAEKRINRIKYTAMISGMK